MPIDTSLTIGALARLAGVNVETIRFYQRKGLLAEPVRPAGGIRHYGESDADRVRFIKSAQHIGFTLEEIGQLLRLADGTHCADARVIAEHKLAEVRTRLASLRRMETALRDMVERCGSAGGQVACPLIEALQGR